MKFEEIINGFSNITGVIPEKSGNGYSFFVDDKFEVYCYKGPEGSCVIESNIHPIPEDEFQKEEFLKKILKTNLGRMYFQNEVISIGENENEIVIFKRILPQEVFSTEDIKKIFENFFNSLEFWYDLLLNTQDDAPVSQQMIFFP